MAFRAVLEKIISVIMSFIVNIETLLGMGIVLPNQKKQINLNRFQLVFSDEFDGDSLNTDIWGPHSGVGYGETSLRNGAYWNTDMVEVYDGNLHIKAAYKENGINEGDPAGWYSAGIDTRKSLNQTKGYFEIRCILPEGYGLMAAFWLMCDSMGDTTLEGVNGAEIDIFESNRWGFSTQNNAVSHCIHYDGYGAQHRSSGARVYETGNNPYKEYNTYGLEWNDQYYIFYINGKETMRSNFGGISQVPEYTILSLHINGVNGVPQSGGFPYGSMEDNGRDFVADFVVDYFRVYEHK